jgi:recombination protein RecA
MFDHGISYFGDLLDLGVEQGVVEKQGSWLSCGDVRLGQGREQAKSFLAQNKDLAEEIRQAILAKGLPATTGPVSEEEKKESEE